jgi:hypothetical protein
VTSAVDRTSLVWIGSDIVIIVVDIASKGADVEVCGRSSTTVVGIGGDFRGIIYTDALPFEMQDVLSEVGDCSIPFFQQVDELVGG